MLVATRMAVHAAPAVSQRRHSYAYAVGLSDHVPVEAFNSCPTTALPLIAGRPVFAGGETVGTYEAVSE